MRELRQITWVDTGQQMASTWTSPELVTERAKDLDTTVVTVGFVIHWGEDFVLVAQSIDNESGAVAGVMRIEQRSITNVHIPNGSRSGE